MLKMADDCAGQRLNLVAFAIGFIQPQGGGLKKLLTRGEVLNFGALLTFDQNLHRAIGQLEQLQHRGNRAGAVNVIDGRIIVAGFLLGCQQDLLVGRHHIFQRAHRFVPADKQRHDHMRKNHNVAQGKHGEGLNPLRSRRSP